MSGFHLCDALFLSDKRILQLGSFWRYNVLSALSHPQVARDDGRPTSFTGHIAAAVTAVRINAQSGRRTTNSIFWPGFCCCLRPAEYTGFLDVEESAFVTRHSLFDRLLVLYLTVGTVDARVYREMLRPSRVGAIAALRIGHIYP